METHASWLKELDQLLRGDKTRAIMESQGTQAIRIQACIGAAVCLGIIYGVCMGLFAVLTRTPPSWPQLLLTAVKVPALFLLTLLVTLPSLYVFSALLGTRLQPLDVLRVLLAAIAVNLCVLAAFGPITAFFTISTTSYAFMKILNVVFFIIAGILGLVFLVRVLGLLEDRLEAKPTAQVIPPVINAPTPSENALRLPKPPPVSAPRITRVLGIWLVLYALVGAQMGWVLRPFIGSPDLPVTFFREEKWGNAYVEILQMLARLFR